MNERAGTGAPHGGLAAGGEDRLVYMDNSSTTRPAPEVVEAMRKVLEEDFGNPSSLHRLGTASSRIVRNARKSVASLIGADETEIVFTSGGTEANNWAIFGTLRSLGDRSTHIVTSTVEHPSIMATVEYLRDSGYDVTLVPVDGEGFVDPEKVLKSVRKDTALVSIMLVQNEIGTVEPCREIGRLLSSLGPRRPRFHVDAVQGFGRLDIDVKKWGIDLLSMSAHKIHGPKGVGALYVRRGLRMGPLIFGGGQEAGLRSGTENVPGIAGMGAACEMWGKDRVEVLGRLAVLRKKLIEGVREAWPEAVLHGPESANVAPYIVHFSFPGFRGESILHALEKRGVFVSTGSACSSHKAKPSPIILALGRSEEEALSAIRFSMSRYTTEEEVAITVEALKESLKELLPWRESRR
ncbi:MAG: cysteine desulfurase [Candidatus Fermentithermobacillus carboniphilus]|uniref:Cysteine desulfurase n=1 Tax=Candidatus Fermentithermobacillus carboniphilus TaxID=3085328 RepID=A0AAT9LEN0_9FIRM|nr:MAG: cysteine desulfurase [Candidatus Fermentithermobacillus carboniphilus]